MSTKVAMPAVRQNRSKLAPISRQASSTPAATAVAGVISLFMALLSFVDSPPRAYGLKAGNAGPPISTMGGTSPLGLVSESDMEAAAVLKLYDEGGGTKGAKKFRVA